MLPGEVRPFEVRAHRFGKEAGFGMEMLRSGAPRGVGTKQVLRAVKAGRISRAYVGSDADTFIYQQVVRTAEEAGIPCVRVGSMKELGILCGLDVPAAAAGILK